MTFTVNIIWMGTAFWQNLKFSFYWTTLGQWILTKNGSFSLLTKIRMNWSLRRNSIWYLSIEFYMFSLNYININNKITGSERMITLFELKNKSFCRCFIRTPFYIKNIVLLIMLSFTLAVIYLIYFSRDKSGTL